MPKKPLTFRLVSAAENLHIKNLMKILVKELNPRKLGSTTVATDLPTLIYRAWELGVMEKAFLLWVIFQVKG